MTIRAWRWLVFTAVVAPCIGIASGAPPAPDRKSGGEDPSLERARLQAKLLRMLEAMSPPPSAPHAPAPLPGSVKPPNHDTSSVDISKNIDSIRAATNYFKADDFEAARRTLVLADPATLSPEDQVYVRYLLACCYRRLGRVQEAIDNYRDVANSKTDGFLANCAISQLALIKTDEELQAQLGQLRSRAKNK